jgi:hypothetical protein
VRLPRRFLVHTVTVRPYLGQSSTGKVYGPEFTLQCMAQGRRRMVRNGQGSEVLSTLTLLAAPGQAEAIPVGSQVLWQGDTTDVLTSTNQDSGGLGAPDHTEVTCE